MIYRVIMVNEPNQINPNAQQTAALLIFPPEVSKQQAEAFLQRILQHNAPRWDIQLQTQTFNPTFGGVTIYQP